ncbi:MAG TPA: peptidylprolyl isomerase [Thermomicrobiales bacterium]|nr:peptidylprolyl isomerase [Thermomicrobiales bacterium]
MVPVPKKRVSRHQRDLQRQRLVRIAMAIVAGLALLLLAGGALNEYVLKPRQTLATVDGVDIHRADYWKVRAVDLLEQARQYEQFANQIGPDQGGQYLQLAQQSLAEVPEVWGSTDVDQTTLSRMVDDHLFLRGLGDLGGEVAPEEAEIWMLRQFEPLDTPLQTPTPAATLIPARAATATATARAEALEQLGQPGFAPTPAPLPNPPGSLASPAAQPTDAVAAPDAAAARSTAEAGLTAFEDSFFAEARINRDDFRRLVAVPAVAREEVQAALAAEIGQEAPQVKGRHILVATEDLAREIATELSGGADFAEVARTRSSDEATAANGGDLGWFVAEEMVAPFAEVAFALRPGETSEPLQTEFGWHIVRVDEADPARPLTDAQITRMEQVRTDRWLEEQRQTATIDSSLGPTPTPFAGTFQPPLDAPAPPPPTIPPATPVLVPAEAVASPTG